MGLLIADIVLAIVIACIAGAKRRDPFLWFVYGALFSLIAFLHVLFVGEGGPKTRCPHCAETIKAEANVCRFCGRDVHEEEKVVAPATQLAQAARLVPATRLAPPPSGLDAVDDMRPWNLDVRPVGPTYRS